MLSLLNVWPIRKIITISSCQSLSNIINNHLNHDKIENIKYFSKKTIQRKHLANYKDV